MPFRRASVPGEKNEPSEAASEDSGMCCACTRRQENFCIVLQFRSQITFLLLSQDSVMNARSPLSLLLSSLATFSAGCMAIVPNGYVSAQRVEIIRGSVRELDKPAVTYEVQRCVDRLNGITYRLKAIRNTRTVLSVVGGTATVVSGVTGLLLPDGSRDQKIVTGVVTAASGLLVLLGSILGNSDADAKVNLAGQSLFDSAQAVADRLQAQRHLSTVDNPEDIRLLKALLRQCGNISTYSADIKEVSATEGVDQSTVDRINEITTEAKTSLEGIEKFYTEMKKFDSDHSTLSTIPSSNIKNLKLEEKLRNAQDAKQTLKGHVQTLFNMALIQHPSKLSILRSLISTGDALSQGNTMLTEIEGLIKKIQDKCKKDDSTPCQSLTQNKN